MMNWRHGREERWRALSGDGLHMSDLGYRCVAHALAMAIEGAGEEALVARGSPGLTRGAALQRPPARFQNEAARFGATGRFLPSASAA